MKEGQTDSYDLDYCTKLWSHTSENVEEILPRLAVLFKLTPSLLKCVERKRTHSGVNRFKIEIREDYTTVFKTYRCYDIRWASHVQRDHPKYQCYL